jgi:hypothetical protein
MSAIAKEKVFDELRKYHLDAFPKKLATERMDEMRAEFELTEDKVITMLLRLVNGKEVFADTTKELHEFQKKIEALPQASPDEVENQNLFKLKINGLLDILAFAKQSDFQLRKVRLKKGAK